MSEPQTSTDSTSGRDGGNPIGVESLAGGHACLMGARPDEETLRNLILKRLVCSAAGESLPSSPVAFEASAPLCNLLHKGERARERSRSASSPNPVTPVYAESRQA
ncbi:hypothetical protein CSOJ01_08006 [Colletotrichum sojae]|uniref:Uncharacterized protein n=1 Tax=Colletotrichum sojae TaxID=2175907 RepID=A0A8H6J820_9PEZI|nr:hypothetical protein CSOJ01_08006 [Colletotrichum sojae]